MAMLAKMSAEVKVRLRDCEDIVKEIRIVGVHFAGRACVGGGNWE